MNDTTSCAYVLKGSICKIDATVSLILGISIVAVFQTVFKSTSKYP
jgi:hypothetical protein